MVEPSYKVNYVLNMACLVKEGEFSFPFLTYPKNN
jgi:hypothetical protein